MTRRAKGEKRRPIISGVIWLGLGLFLLARQAELVPSITQSWPVILMIIGVAIICGAFVRRTRPADPYSQQSGNSGGTPGQPSV
jgi:hypothetical protein